jgi:vacuolar-type H+-ATPase subunit H
MDDTLQRLLDAELRAEKIAQHAETERDRLIQAALDEARSNEEQFVRGIPELHASFTQKAEARAEAAIAELKRRYDEHHTQMRELVDQREDTVLGTAFTFLIDPATDHTQSSAGG